MKSKINIVQFIDWRCFFFIIDTCGVLKKGLPEKGPTKFHFSRDYWLFYTAISRKVVGENVRATIPKGDTGYDQYTVPDTVSSCRSYFCFFLLAPANIHPWPLVSFFQTSLKNSEFKTTHNTFRDCRVHFSYNLSRNSCIPVMYFSLRSRLAYFPLTLTEQYYEAKDLSSFPVNKGTSWRFGFKKCGHVT